MDIYGNIKLIEEQNIIHLWYEAVIRWTLSSPANWISLSERTGSMEKCHLKDKYIATLFICIVFEAMDGPRDYHMKHSKSDRKRQLSYDITCMWNL